MEPLVIDLYPREAECVICGALADNCGLPMYEGRTVPADHEGEWGGFDCCRSCYRRWETGETLSEGDALATLGRLLDEADLVPCLWFGLPPCPLCGGDHGDPEAPPGKDADLRAQVAAQDHWAWSEAALGRQPRIDLRRAS